MTDDEKLMQQALEALEEINKLSIGEHAICLPAEIDGAMDALRERLAQPQRTHWEGCEEVHPECKTRRTTREEKIVRPGVYEVPVEQETVMAEYKFQTYAAYKTPDGEMKIGVVPEQEQAMLDAITGGTGVMLGGKRIDPSTIYKEPEQEPVAWRWKERINGDFDSWVISASEPPPYAIEQQPLYIIPPQRKPLTDEMVKRMKENCTSMEMRGAFADGWLSAEAAHGIKGEA